MPCSEIDGRIADDAGDVVHIRIVVAAVVVLLEELQQVVGEDFPHADPRLAVVHRFEQQGHAVGRGQDGAFAVKRIAGARDGRLAR